MHLPVLSALSTSPPPPGLSQTKPLPLGTMFRVSAQLSEEPGLGIRIWKAKISLGLGWEWRGLT